ncbi:uncharacterized protein METZ01_LOCUS278514, partial [marine metagenome]
MNWEFKSNNDLDLKAIATFSCLGFMLDQDTFYSDIKVIRPSTKVTLKNNTIIGSEKIWFWHYEPAERSFTDIVDEFTAIFEKNVYNETNGKKILLPISGGLDSRSLFVSLKDKSNLTLSAYEFEEGIDEICYGKELSDKFQIPLYAQKIPKSYLWNKLDQIADLNGCFTEFTQPRQMAAIDNWKSLGDKILLGHWGDVLFDKQANSNYISYDEEINALKKKILNPGGMEIATDLWKYWNLGGSFE